MFRKVLDIKLEILPEEEVSDLTDLHQVLLLSLRMQGKFSEATKIQKVVVANLLQVHGEDHPGVAMSYVGIARLLSDQKRFDDALHMLEKSTFVLDFNGEETSM